MRPALAVGLLMTVVALGIVGRRVHMLAQLFRTGQPRPDATPLDPRDAVQAEAVEVLGQRKLLKWTVPGLAHFFAFWGFLVLGLTIVEAFGALLYPT